MEGYVLVKENLGQPWVLQNDGDSPDCPNYFWRNCQLDLASGVRTATIFCSEEIAKAVESNPWWFKETQFAVAVEKEDGKPTELRDAGEKIPIQDLLTALEAAHTIPS